MAIGCDKTMKMKSFDSHPQIKQVISHFEYIVSQMSDISGLYLLIYYYGVAVLSV